VRECVRGEGPDKRRSAYGRSRRLRRARLEEWQREGRGRTTEAALARMRAWWHLAVAFKLRGPQLSSGVHGAQRTALSTSGLAGRSASA